MKNGIRINKNKHDSYDGSENNSPLKNSGREGGESVKNILEQVIKRLERLKSRDSSL
jgi:hypothetical protein